MEFCVGQNLITVGLVLDILGVGIIFLAGSLRSKQIGKVGGGKQGNRIITVHSPTR